MKPRDFNARARDVAPFGWFDDAVDFVAAKMDRDGSHDFGHLLRVLRNARAITDGALDRGEQPDWEVVAAAALMHDLVNLPKDHPDRSHASTLSAREATSFFEPRGVFSKRRLEIVADAIRTHSFSAGLEPAYLESRIVCDADRLEALGAFGLARCFQVSGMLDRALVDMADPWAEDRELDDYEFAVDHFFTKLLTLEDTFFTEEGRQMASQRTTFIRDFIEQLDHEIDATRD